MRMEKFHGGKLKGLRGPKIPKVSLKRERISKGSAKLHRPKIKGYGKVHGRLEI